jgi:pyruvate dehydrogenase E1 component alpha subunit
MPKIPVKMELLSDMLRKMLMARLFEEKIEALFMQNLIGGTVHLYIGQEAIAVGACSAIGKKDYIVSNHRGHGHCIAKGGDIKKIMAEILGKETGYCRGKGGSMHVSDIEIGNLGANGIVGAGIPIATGAALALKLQHRKQVVVCFFGDGASNTGAFHEGVNLASIYSLPVIFVCENNCYAISSPVCNTFCIPNISERAQSYGMPGVSVDGMDVLEIYNAMGEAVERARQGGGPAFIECMTYRFKGHYIGDPCTYRTKEELEAWKKKDPIEKFKRYLKNKKILTAKGIRKIEETVQLEVKEAEQFALNSPEPKGEEAFQAVYES